MNTHKYILIHEFVNIQMGKEVEKEVEEMIEMEVVDTIETVEEIIGSSIEGIIESDESIVMIDPDLEMEDVDMLEVIKRDALIDEPEPVMSVAIIEAVDMIKLSALLSV
jgi:hypothetical protein